MNRVCATATDHKRANTRTSWADEGPDMLGKGCLHIRLMRRKAAIFASAAIELIPQDVDFLGGFVHKFDVGGLA